MKLRIIINGDPDGIVIEGDHKKGILKRAKWYRKKIKKTTNLQWIK